MEFDIERERRRVVDVGVLEFPYPRPIDAHNAFDEEIDALYASLRQHRESGDKQGYEETLARLRAAQEAEAARIGQRVEAWRRLKPDEFDEALRLGHDIIQRHALPSEPDPTTR